jgi:hypothetical protein
MWLENAFVTLTRLAENMEPRMDTREQWFDEIREVQTHTEAKIAALADAHIRMGEGQANGEAKIAALAASQILTEEALKNLAAAQARTDENLDGLVKTVDRHVSEGRNGKS